MIARILIVLVVLVAFDTAAAAQSCGFSISNASFGTVDVIAGGAVDTTATLSINCTSLPLTTVRICPSIGAGSGGATSSSRQLAGSTTSLNYQLYQDAARTTVWGSYDWALPGTPPTIDLPIGLGGSGSTTVTIYGRVLAGQNSVPAGTYSSSFTTADTDFVYAALGVLACPSLLLPVHAHPTFTATATVVNDCLLAAQNINFGSQGVLSASVNANGQVSVTCTSGTSYVVGLNGGNANAAPTARQMAKGAQTITYGLYQDVARSQAWGSTAGTNTVASTGNGLTQNITVYGSVPAQATPSPGTYTDTIVVTVTY